MCVVKAAMRSSLAYFAIAACLSLTAACGGDDDSAADAAAAADANATPDAPIVYDATPVPDAAPSYDATPPELSCLGQPIPNTAPDPISIAGTAFEFSIMGQTPLSGVNISAHLVSDDSMIAGPTTTGAPGTFALSAPSNDVPIDGYFLATHGDKFDTLLYPPTPVYENSDNVVVAMFDTDLLNLLALSGFNQDMNTYGIATVLVLDCEGNPVQGATVTSNPPAGTIAYAANMLPDSTATATDSSGLAFLFNVPTGTVTIDAEVGGQSLREHDVESKLQTLTTTIVVP